MIAEMEYRRLTKIFIGLNIVFFLNLIVPVFIQEWMGAGDHFDHIERYDPENVFMIIILLISNAVSLILFFIKANKAALTAALSPLMILLMLVLFGFVLSVFKTGNTETVSSSSQSNVLRQSGTARK